MEKVVALLVSSLLIFSFVFAANDLEPESGGRKGKICKFLFNLSLEYLNYDCEFSEFLLCGSIS